MIDLHGHAAGLYGSPESLSQLAITYDLEKIVLCPSPRNLQDLREPPKLPFKQEPDSIYLMNRLNRMAYRHFFKDNGDGNRFVYELQRALPELVVQFLWVDPLSAEHMDNLQARIEEYRPGGIKLHQSWNPFRIDDPEFASVAATARAHDLPIYLHPYSRNEIAKLVRFVAQNPENVFIVAHLTGTEVFENSEVSLHNVYFDVSSSDRIKSGDIGRAIKAFGSNHVVFGTDTPYAGIEAGIARIDELGLPANARENVLRLNARRILGLAGGG
jgi:uncharacterized protein